MTLSILSVAYPLAPVSPDAAGGAEQVLSSLDRALVAAGHRSIVVAEAGSRVAGTLLSIAPAKPPFDEPSRADAQARTAAAIREALARWPVDLVHLHGIDFDTYLPPPGPPVLATLHLPAAWYDLAALRPTRPLTWLHGVSAAQHDDLPRTPVILPPISNGVDVEAFAGGRRPGGFALVLSRICAEKGIHVAIEAARKAEVPLAIAGPVFPYEAHLRYFDGAVAPHLGRHCRYLGPVGFRAKRRLLLGARCLLVPSLAPETSSLVVREAAAAGAPVVALRTGALPESVEDGRTGFLVDDAAGMAAAIGRITDIDPDACRTAARERFSATVMAASYLRRYRELVGLVARPNAA